LSVQALVIPTSCGRDENGRLWWNDPDAVVLTGDLTEDEIRFHATAIYASGGMILSGDDLTAMSPQKLAMLRRLLPPTGIAARFDDDTLTVGKIDLPDARVLAIFNWKNQPQTTTVRLPQPAKISDYWTGESMGRHELSLTISSMPAHSARLLVCKS
jgi:alpha-galactosidase